MDDATEGVDDGGKTAEGTLILKNPMQKNKCMQTWHAFSKKGTLILKNPSFQGFNFVIQNWNF